MPWGKRIKKVDIESKWLNHNCTIASAKLLPFCGGLSNDRAPGTNENNSFSKNFCASKDQMNFLKAFLDKLFGSICM